MEKELILWIEEEINSHNKWPSKKSIKNKAVSFSARPNIFKASKGWLDKFL